MEPNLEQNSLAEVVIKVERKKDSGPWTEISLSATRTRDFYGKKTASSVSEKVFTAFDQMVPLRG